MSDEDLPRPKWVKFAAGSQGGYGVLAIGQVARPDLRFRLTAQAAHTLAIDAVLAAAKIDLADWDSGRSGSMQMAGFIPARLTVNPADKRLGELQVGHFTFRVVIEENKFFDGREPEWTD